jgi:hypothetical protein
MRTAEQKQQEAKVYLQKSSKHIFINGNGEYWALVDKGNGNYSTVTSKETRTWEEINKYARYYSDLKRFYKGRFFPEATPQHMRDRVYTAIRRSRVDPAFLELINVTKAGN